MFTIFGSSSPFDVDVEKSTSENNTTEQWDVIIDICDRAGTSTKNAKDCIRSIMKRIGHNDPHVAIQAITLLDSCIKNCGKTFHLEIASRDFETEFQRLMNKTSAPVAKKMRVFLKKWAECEFKLDHELNLIPSLYNKMISEGLDFSESVVESPKIHTISKNPGVTSTQHEEEDIAKAIELSMKESNIKKTSLSTIYPNVNFNEKSTVDAFKKSGKKVQALYDFEAAEDNELTFSTGEIIYVLDDSDDNWWIGYNDRGEGLFPANFVTADLNVNIALGHSQNRINEENNEDQGKNLNEEIIQIDEMKIDRLLFLLHEANPEDPSQDSEEMFVLEAQVNQMLPLIDSELECVDRNHAKLTQLSTNLVEAINMYHILMRESEGFGQSHVYRQPFYVSHPHTGNQFINHAVPMPQNDALQTNLSASIPLSLMTAQQYQQLISVPAVAEQYGQNPHLSLSYAPQQFPNTVMTTQIQNSTSQQDQHLYHS